MWSALALIIVLVQDGAVVAGKLNPSFAPLHQLLLSYSPITILMNLFKSGPTLADITSIMIIMGLGHLFKYFTFAMAQLKEEASTMLYAAIALEAAYLAYSGYWLM